MVEKQSTLPAKMLLLVLLSLLAVALYVLDSSFLVFLSPPLRSSLTHSPALLPPRSGSADDLSAAPPAPGAAAASAADLSLAEGVSARASAGVEAAALHARCGHAEHQPFVDAATAAQVYETPAVIAAVNADLAARRRLSPGQLYSDSASFVPISEAHQAGQTAPLRITLVWDAVLAGDLTGSVGAPRQCGFVGQPIEVKTSSGTWAQWTTANFPGTSPCDAASVVSAASPAGAARLAAMQARTRAAMDFWSQTIKVKPVQDPIVLGAQLMTDFGVTGPAGGYSDTDLVMVMTARPSPASPIAGFAVCYQRDQRGRCTVGQFNWVPNILNVDSPTDNQVVESEMHTALHEIVHVLGGVGPGAAVSATPFLDAATGAQLASGVFLQQVDPAYNNPAKLRTLITTPRVRNFTRAYFKCPTAEGFPLEDLPLGSEFASLDTRARAARA